MTEPTIVSCSPAHTEIICNLKKENLILGKTTYCDFPSDLLKEKTIVGSWTKFNFEKILELRPNIIITSSIVQGKIAHQLKDLGLNVYHFDPLTLDQVFQDFIEIGKIINAENNAKDLVSNIKKSLDEIQKASSNIGTKPKVYIEEWHDPPTISGNWIPELVEIAGGQYDLIEKGKRSTPISIDKLFEYNPDKIVTSWCGFGEKVDIIQVLNRSGWDSLKAIQNKEVSVIDDSLLNRPGPRILDGVKKLQEIFSKKASVN